MLQRPSAELLAFLFIVALAAFRVFYTSGLDLHPDEAYYYLWSLRLDLSYFDHPPMVAYLFATLNPFFDDSVLVIRLVTILGSPDVRVGSLKSA